MHLAGAHWLLAQEAGNLWTEQFLRMSQGQQFVLLLVALGGGIGIVISTVAMITGLIASIHRRRLEATMKLDLIDRGMNADEIAKIIESSAPKDAIDRWVASWGKQDSGV